MATDEDLSAFLMMMFRHVKGQIMLCVLLDFNYSDSDTSLCSVKFHE